MKQNLKNHYRNKNILITGGASFIGSHLAELLLSLGANIKIIDDLSSGNQKNLRSIVNEINLRRKGFVR